MGRSRATGHGTALHTPSAQKDTDTHTAVTQADTTEWLSEGEVERRKGREARGWEVGTVVGTSLVPSSFSVLWGEHGGCSCAGRCRTLCHVDTGYFSGPARMLETGSSARLLCALASQRVHNLCGCVEKKLCCQLCLFGLVYSPFLHRFFGKLVWVLWTGMACHSGPGSSVDELGDGPSCGFEMLMRIVCQMLNTE